MPASTHREFSDQELFERIADDYARKDIIPSTMIARADIIRRAVKPLMAGGENLGVLVDVGCGVAAQALYLDGTFERYIGIDYSSSLISIGRDLTAALDNVELIAANIKSAEVPENIADTILVVGALHHMTDLDDVMATLRRVSKPGGRLVAIEPQSANWLIQGLRRVRMKLDRNYSAEQHFFTKHEMEEVLRKADINDIRVDYQGFLTPPFAQVVLNPQALFGPVSRLVTNLEGAAQAILPGPLSWNLVAYGRF